MQLIEATLLLLFLTTITVPWARRIGLPIEILLVIGSLILSLIPGLPPLMLNPEVVFMLFLPPILFAAAYFTSWRDFKRNRRPIFLLSFGLVLFTTTLVAIAVRSLGLGVSWPAAFLLGAIVSPPDASAATAIVRKLGLPRRLVTIIEGESLVNDATALVAFRFALAAIATGSFSFGDAAWQFVLVAVGGGVVGLAVAVGGIFIVRRLNNSTAETTLTLVTSFAAYIFAERLGFSGVISTVVGGLYYGRRLPAVTSAQTHLEAEATWNTLLFIINGLVFTLIGLQMPAVMRGLDGLLLATTGVLRRNHFICCPGRPIHLDVPGGVPAEKALSIDRPQGPYATRGGHHCVELDRDEGHRFSGGGIVHSIDLAIGRRVSL